MMHEIDWKLKRVVRPMLSLLLPLTVCVESTRQEVSSASDRVRIGDGRGGND